MHALATAITDLFKKCDVSDDWSTITASLIPKVAVPKGPKDFRPIAALTSLRKLIGYIFMLTLPEASYKSFQCGFVPKRDATQAVFCVKRLGELAREWGKPVFAAQLDMSKAFDKVLHSSVLEALQGLGAGKQHLAFLSSMLMKGSVQLRLGNVSTRSVRLDRGVPQGAPESPSLFIAVTDMALGKVQDSWREKNIGYTFDGVWLPVVAYADDVMILATSEEELALMLADVAAAFDQVWLSLNMSKTNYSSSLPSKDSTIAVKGEEISWRKDLTFLGSCITLPGNGEAAMRSRKAKATRVFDEWAPVLTSSKLPAKMRADAFKASVIPSFCWQAQSWTLTKVQSQHVASWSSRLGSRMKGSRRSSCEEPGQWWRRMHREGKRFLDENHIDIPHEVCLAKHSFAGHIARMPEQDVANKVLRLRNLAWWRQVQATPQQMPKHGPRPHPKRFNALCRWEAPLEEKWGRAQAGSTADTVGWMLIAQDRERWRSLRSAL